MINTINSTFDCRPKRFDSIHVSNTANVLFCGVLYYFVSITKTFNVVIARQFVSKYYGLICFRYSRFNHRQKSVGFNIRDYLCNSVAVPLYQSHNYRFTSSTTTTLALPFTTDIRFVNFNLSRERINTLIHKFTNLIKHSPSGFICNSEFSFKLFGRDSSLCRSHQEYSVKPRTERSIGFMKDSSSSRRHVRTAEITGIDFAIGNSVMSGYLLALFAVNTVRPSSLFEIFKASIFIRELFVEIFNSIGFHFLSPRLIYTYTIAYNIRAVKVYLPNIFNNITTENNTESISISTGQRNIFNNCSFNEATQVIGATSYANSTVYSNNQSGSVSGNWVYTDDGTINSQTATRHTASGIAWMFSPGSTRLSYYPLSLSIAKIACTGGKAITFKAWVKKDHATNIAARLIVYGGRVTGIASDVTVTKANDTDWEELTLPSFTPTNADVVEVYMEAWYVAGASYAYVDDITISEAA